MKKYIDKDALMAEIERWIELLTNEKNQEGVSQIDKLSLGGRIAELQEVKTFIDTLEVKEVDLEKEIDNYLDDNFYISETWGIFSEKTENEINQSDLEDIAKHFFELGIKAQKGE